MPKFCDMRIAYIKHGKEKEFDMTIVGVCEYLMRQTDYDYKTAFEKLIHHDMNTVDVIREWMGAPIVNKQHIPRSNNQMVFEEFRKFLDEASNNYYKKKTDEEESIKFDAHILNEWVNIEPTNQIITQYNQDNNCK
jgi:hypothetical protein